ncbi:MAG: molybdopterin biosynthesis protein [Thermoleophilia bacterium]|nr:molybdopterin biosynthesis protein [Thermoleophilia bacterium]
MPTPPPPPPRIPVIVLAAGSSARFGTLDKLATPIAGRPLLAWTLAALPHTLAQHDRIVVVGPGSGAPARIGAGAGCRLVRAHDAERGLRHSILAGLDAVRDEDPEVAGAVLLLGDDPLVARLLPDVLEAAVADPTRTVAVRRSRFVPHPVYLPRATWPSRDVLSSGHDHGLRDMVAALDPTWIDGSAAPSLDVDVQADATELARLLAPRVD